LAISTSSSERKYIVPAVERAIHILQLLAQESDGLTISQIAKRLPISKSTVFTTLTTLKQYRMVDQVEDTGRYQLGMGLFILGSTVVETLNIRATAYPILKRLANDMGMTTHLGICDEGEIIYIEKLEGQGPIKISSAIGRRMGIHCTALGKAILSQLPEAEVQAILAKKGLSRRTPNTKTTLEELQADLVRTHERGYALDDEENELGIRCLAAPIKNYRREVICAISSSGTHDKVSLDRVDELAKQVKKAADEISATLGYVPA